MTKIDKKSCTPLCIRFRVINVAKIKSLASKNNVNCSSFIRTIVLDRAKKILDKEKISPLNIFNTDKKYGEQICIRFSDDELLTIRRAAITEGFLPSPWIRTIMSQIIEENNEL